MPKEMACFPRFCAAEKSVPRPAWCHQEQDDWIAATHHGNQHLAGVRRVAVQSIRQHKSEVKVGAPLGHDDTSKVSDPVQVPLRSEAKHDQARWREQHRWETDTESHLSLANHAVPLGKPGCEAVGGSGKGNGKAVSDDGGYRDKTTVQLAPIVRRGGDLERHDVVESESPKANVNTCSCG